MRVLVQLSPRLPGSAAWCMCGAGAPAEPARTMASWAASAASKAGERTPDAADAASGPTGNGIGLSPTTGERRGCGDPTAAAAAVRCCAARSIACEVMGGGSVEVHNFPAQPTEKHH